MTAGPRTVPPGRRSAAVLVCAGAGTDRSSPVKTTPASNNMDWKLGNHSDHVLLVITKFTCHSIFNVKYEYAVQYLMYVLPTDNDLYCCLQ
jgi:hypothetical protein